MGILLSSVLCSNLPLLDVWPGEENSPPLPLPRMPQQGKPSREEIRFKPHSGHQSTWRGPWAVRQERRSAQVKHLPKHAFGASSRLPAPGSRRVGEEGRVGEEEPEEEEEPEAGSATWRCSAGSDEGGSDEEGAGGGGVWDDTEAGEE
jgi:hypothetical protein